MSLLGSEMLSAARAEKLEYRSALRRQLEPAVTKLPKSVVQAVGLHAITFPDRK